MVLIFRKHFYGSKKPSRDMTAQVRPHMQITVLLSLQQSRNKQINWKSSRGRSQENEML